MAKHFDLEEQEQLDQLKHFWKTWGTVITAALVLVSAGVAGWNGYNYWQKSQSAQAAALESQVQTALVAKDTARADLAFADMKDKFGSTVQAAQTGLLMAKTAVDAGKFDEAKAALAWVAEKGDEGYKPLAKLRLAGVLLQQQQYDEGLKALEGAVPESFTGLVADRRGDLLSAQGKAPEAITQYQAAYKALDKDLNYRHLVEFKLNALGTRPDVVAEVKIKTTAEN